MLRHGERLSYNRLMRTLNYEFKLKPTKRQVEQIEKDLETCRKVWNYALRERKDWIASRKRPINSCSLVSEYIIAADEPYPGYVVQAKRLTQAKKLNLELAATNAQALQQVLKTLDQRF